MKKVNKRILIKKLYPYIHDTSLKFKWFSLLKFRNERPHWFNEQVRINSSIPPYPSQSFDRIVDIIKNKKRLPHTIDFAVTSRCPYHCPYCSYGNRRKDELDLDDILSVIKDIKEMGTAILGITGGEPMIRSDLEQIVAECFPELTTILFTTGFNFNEKRAEMLHDAHIGSIIISIDSVDAKTQDKIKGKPGSLELGIKALELCHEIGIYTVINTIATRERMQNGEIERIYNLACSLNVGELKINFPIATGQWIRCSTEHLKVEELEMLKSLRKRLNKKRSGPIVTTLAEYETKDCLGCNTGYQTLFIDASGEVCPCDFTPLSFGNIKGTSLKDIWKNMEEYFPRPRAECLMREITHKIHSDVLPLSPNDSKKMIPKLDKNSSSPKIYKLLTRQE